MVAPIIAWGLAVAAAALWTGAQAGFHICSMTGFLPPHYGYSAYAVVPLLFLAPGRMKLFAGFVLLLSQNRASWVGAIAGWAWSRRTPARLAAAVLLAAFAVAGGLAFKPYGVRGDSVRIHIWKAAARQAVRAPGEFCIGVGGYVVTKAHSDVMQLAAERGWKIAALALLVLGWAFCRLPESPAKAVVLALSVQSFVDNRLHHPACAALYVAAWIAAFSVVKEGAALHAR